jgi:hypothetical protein
LGHTLAGADRHANAADALMEGLAMIGPFVERHAQAFGCLARALSQDYIATCEKAGVARDVALVEWVARALEST